MKCKYWWIKERHNPQIGVYYTPLGQVSIAYAKKLERPLYGYNVMLRFENQKDYESKLKEIQEKQEKSDL